MPYHVLSIAPSMLVKQTKYSFVEASDAPKHYKTNELFTFTCPDDYFIVWNTIDNLQKPYKNQDNHTDRMHISWKCLGKSIQIRGQFLGNLIEHPSKSLGISSGISWKIHRNSWTFPREIHGKSIDISRTFQNPQISTENQNSTLILFQQDIKRRLWQ